MAVVLLLCCLDGRGSPPVFFAAIALGYLVHSTWYWFYPPEDASLQLTSDRLVWNIPYFPATTQSLPLSEIVGGWTIGWLKPEVHLRLLSGDEVVVPPRCVGNNRAGFIRALAEADPRIRVYTEEKEK